MNEDERRVLSERVQEVKDKERQGYSLSDIVSPSEKVPYKTGLPPLISDTDDEGQIVYTRASEEPLSGALYSYGVSDEEPLYQNVIYYGYRPASSRVLSILIVPPSPLDKFISWLNNVICKGPLSQGIPSWPWPKILSGITSKRSLEQNPDQGGVSGIKDAPNVEIEGVSCTQKAPNIGLDAFTNVWENRVMEKDAEQFYQKAIDAAFKALDSHTKALDAHIKSMESRFGYLQWMIGLGFTIILGMLYFSTSSVRQDISSLRNEMNTQIKEMDRRWEMRQVYYEKYLDAKTSNK